MSVIKQDTLPDGKWISTVLLDDPVVNRIDAILNPLLGRQAKPFETMVFPSEDDMIELECIRSDTEAEALSVHARMVAKYGADK